MKPKNEIRIMQVIIIILLLGCLSLATRLHYNDQEIRTLTTDTLNKSRTINSLKSYNLKYQDWLRRTWNFRDTILELNEEEKKIASE